MEIKAKLVDKLQFNAVADSNHAIVIDANKKLSYDQGSRPKELLLVSLATCTGMDVVSILYKMHLEFDDFQVLVKGESTEEHPKVFKKIDLEYIIKGNDIDAEKLEKAIDLSQNRYCGVSAMLKKACELNYDYTINQS
ncbi:MAG: OsmC family protein [Candidatus Cloacimonetes bacterium]|nr:OsmC family protein [Candidatus Cloacimonadota bacterium]MBS3766799.1 OsmC family protein [Candidatus Cloacimonadota bacterium]